MDEWRHQQGVVLYPPIHRWPAQHNDRGDCLLAKEQNMCSLTEKREPHAHTTLSYDHCKAALILMEVKRYGQGIDNEDL
jgi:hypothetical protein